MSRVDVAVELYCVTVMVDNNYEGVEEKGRLHRPSVSSSDIGPPISYIERRKDPLPLKIFKTHPKNFLQLTHLQSSLLTLSWFPS